MRRFAILSLTMIILLTSYLFTSAQSQSNPLMLLINGDIWSMENLNATPYQETYWGYNNSMSLSPNGQYLIYRSYPDWLVARDLAGVVRIDIDGYPPTNIWLMEIATRTFTRIATQEEPPIDEPYQFIRRTIPTWSPDSTQIAWLELESNSERGLHLVIYDLENDSTTHAHSNMSGAWGDAGFVSLPSATWGEALAYRGNSNSNNITGLGLTILDSDNIIIERVIADFNRNPEFNVQDWRWVEYEGQQYIALRYVHGWQLWDYKTDTTFDVTSEPTLQTQSGQGLHLSYEATERRWTIIEANGNRVLLPERISSVALSPDGTSVAYVRWDYGDPNIVSYFELWQDGVTSSLANIEAINTSNQVIWESMVWRVEGAVSQLPALTPIPTSTQSG